MKTQLVYLSFVLIVVVFFSSCKKDELQTPVNYETLAEDVMLGDQVYSDIFRSVNNQSGNVQNEDESGKAEDNCGIVSVTGYLNGWPTALSIDFGNGCTDDQGVVRKGKILVVYNGPYFTAGSSLTVTMADYLINGHTLEGSVVIWNKGMNNNGNYEFIVSVQSGSIIKPNGTTVTFESERSFEWTEGDELHGLLGWCDNTWMVTGFSEGTTSDGRDYRVEITTPLKKKGCCPWVVEGFIDITVDGSQTATLDYGNGFCDRLAQYSYNENIVEITIP